MKSVRVLHLASFDGNIGDNANHNGVRYLWKKHLPEYDFRITPLEMREFYWKWRNFDEDFVELVNAHDLFVCGGGNYFEMWVEHSPTGTSVAIPVELLEKIRTPCLFYALGLDPHMGAPEVCVTRFKRFLDYVLSSERCLTAVRNDGSMDSARRVLGDAYADRIHLMPDGGHFVQPKNVFHPELDSNARTIGVNLAGDMPGFRFSDASGNAWENFLEKLCRMFSGIMSREKDVNLILYPHIHKDFDFISSFCRHLPDHLLRRRVTVAPYLHGQGSEEYLFDIYRKCSANIGMRLHSNICSVGLNVPSVGLITHPQIEHLYGYYGMPERAVRVAESDFAEKAEELLAQGLNDPGPIRSRYAQAMRKVEADATAFLSVLRSWLKNVL